MTSNILSEGPDSPMSISSVSLSSRLGKMKILIIDDEPANVALLERMLTDGGYSRVRSITDARTALNACNDFEPDLILLDLMMPYIDGLTILQMLRTRQSEVFLPVLVLTADVNEETKVNALKAGATDFLLKPFDQLEASLRIANLLEIRRLHIQLDTQCAAFEEALHARMSELRDMDKSR
jgi:putative two-component system response regulator